ncbi:hypothetical protein J7443_23475 [Tropicibacter sp. R15_0]|uniref:hypothetical protein n=1 Tax=Tropicibacter sp. R15_0 TaxID=2821101 RepID=UPI001ADBB3FA|nr:hypothetical protein [Tropicibacter sp. R15_0]MBO9468207.1 hypothetical protein [Tropicibacter sp. R15_0]
MANDLFGAGGFSFSAFGSILSGDVSIDLRDTAFFRNDKNFNYTDNSKTTIIILNAPPRNENGSDGSGDRGRSERKVQTLEQSETQYTVSKNCNDDHPELPSAPFKLKTTLVFDDADIVAFSEFKLGGVPVTVVGDKLSRALVPRYSAFDLAQVKGKLALRSNDTWALFRTKKYAEIPPFPEAGVIETPSYSAAGHLKSDERVLSLYRLPLDVPISLSGQDTVFASNAITDVCMAMVRTCGPNATLASSPILLILPRFFDGVDP